MMKEELLPSIIVTNLSAGTNQTLNPPSHTWSFSRFLISVNGTTIHAVMQARRQKSALHCPLPPPPRTQSITKSCQRAPKHIHFSPFTSHCLGSMLLPPLTWATPTVFACTFTLLLILRLQVQ